jgi:hypothetical protein
MHQDKLNELIDRLNELRFRLEPVEQHWGWTAEELHRELRHVLHTLNGLVTEFRAAAAPHDPGGVSPADTADEQQGRR